MRQINDRPPDKGMDKSAPNAADVVPVATAYGIAVFEILRQYRSADAHS